MPSAGTCPVPANDPIGKCCPSMLKPLVSATGAGVGAGGVSGAGSATGVVSGVACGCDSATDVAVVACEASLVGSGADTDVAWLELTDVALVLDDCLM